MKKNGGWLALAAVSLCLSGCAGSSVTARDGTTYSAWSIGQGHAAAGRCDRVASDESESTEQTEKRVSKEDSRGELCAIASGGRGSVSAWATVAGAFAALFAFLAL